jgi:hypothetical protein
MIEAEKNYIDQLAFEAINPSNQIIRNSYSSENLSGDFTGRLQFFNCDFKDLKLNISEGPFSFIVIECTFDNVEIFIGRNGVFELKKCKGIKITAQGEDQTSKLIIKESKIDKGEFEKLNFNPSDLDHINVIDAIECKFNSGDYNFKKFKISRGVIDYVKLAH